MSGRHSPQFADCCGICGNEDSVSFSSLRKFLCDDGVWLLTSKWTDNILTVYCIFLWLCWVLCTMLLYSFQDELDILGSMVNPCVPGNFSYHRWKFGSLPFSSYKGNFRVQSLKPSLKGQCFKLVSTSCGGLWRMLPLPSTSRSILRTFPYHSKNCREQRFCSKWCRKSLSH